MKKSTIFLLVIVYIASFLIVGIFGISVKSYDSTYYVEKVNIELPESQVEGVNPIISKFEADATIKRHNTCVIRFNYFEKEDENDIGCVVRIKAAVYPTNATTTELRLQAPEVSDVAEITQEDNVYFNVSFKVKASYKFNIYSTDGYGAYTTVQLMYNFEI